MYDFHKANIHPLAVVENLEKGDIPFRKWCQANSKVCETSVDDPLHLQPKV